MAPLNENSRTENRRTENRRTENRRTDEISRKNEVARTPAENLERAIVGIFTPLTERLGLVMEGLERWLERRSTTGSGSAGGEGFVPDLAPGMLTGELLEAETLRAPEESTSS